MADKALGSSVADIVINPAAVTSMLSILFFIAYIHIIILFVRESLKIQKTNAVPILKQNYSQ